MTELGPQFHGTSADLHPGDKVLPAKEAGVKSNWAGHRHSGGKATSRFAFSTSDEGQAWTFADHAHNRTGERTSVLQVDPHPEQKRGLHHQDSLSVKQGHRDRIPGEMVAPEFSVSKRIDIRPGHQGTFPEVNWHQFSSDRRPTYGDDFNHPTSTHEEFGHAGFFNNKKTPKGRGLEAFAVNEHEPNPHQKGLF